LNGETALVNKSIMRKLDALGLVFFNVVMILLMGFIHILNYGAWNMGGDTLSFIVIEVMILGFALYNFINLIKHVKHLLIALRMI